MDWEKDDVLMKARKMNRNLFKSGQVKQAR
jgi:hypothetical protein